MTVRGTQGNNDNKEDDMQFGVLNLQTYEVLAFPSEQAARRYVYDSTTPLTQVRIVDARHAFAVEAMAEQLAHEFGPFNRKIQAIKQLREAYHLTLREAKEHMDEAFENAGYGPNRPVDPSPF